MARGDTEQLVVLLEARTRDFEKGLQRANKLANDNLAGIDRRAKQSATALENSMKSATANVAKSFAGLGSNLSSVFAALGGAGVLGGAGLAGVLATLKNTASAVADLRAEAQKAGVGFEQFQELKYAADQNKVSVDALSDGLKELQLRADEFIGTGKGSGAEAFGRLGYSADQLKAKLKDPVALFQEIIDKLAQFDTAAQIRIADEIFGGTAGEQFVRFLQQGQGGIVRLREEARRLGLVLTNEIADKAQEIDREFSKLEARIGAYLKRGVIEGADALQTYKGEIIAVAVALGALAAGATLGPLVGSIAAATSAAATAVRGLTSLNAVVLAVAAAQGTAALAARGLAGALALVGGPWGLAIAGIVATVAYLATRQDQAKVAAEGHAQALNELQAAVAAVRAGVPGATDALKRLADQHLAAAKAALENEEAQLRAVKAIKSAIAGTLPPDAAAIAGAPGGEAEEAARKRIEAQRKRIAEIEAIGNTPATPPPLKYEAPGSLATPKKGGDSYSFDDLLQRSTERVQALAVERNAMGMTTAAAEKYRFVEEALAQARQHGINLTPDQLNQLDALATKYGALQQSIEGVRDAQQRLAETKQLVSGFLTDIRQGLSNGASASDAFKNALLRLSERIVDMMQERLLNELFKGLNGAGGGSGLGSILSGLLGGGSTSRTTGGTVTVNATTANLGGNIGASVGNQIAAGLNPVFDQRLGAFIAAGKAQGYDISVGSGFRTFAQQSALFANSDGSGKRVAPPGRSYHEFGLAADLKYGSDGARQWAQQNASAYGLSYPMSYENWHIEPAGVRQYGSAANASKQWNGGTQGAQALETANRQAAQATEQAATSTSLFGTSTQQAGTSTQNMGTTVKAAGDQAADGLRSAGSASRDAGKGALDFSTGTDKATNSTDQFAAGLGDGLGQLTNGIGKLLMSLMQAPANIAGGLFGGGSTSSSGGLFSSLFSGLGSIFGGFKAEGGPVDPSKFFVVGERGPELFVPSTKGTIVPGITPVSQAMGGSTSTPAGGSSGSNRGTPRGDGGQGQGGGNTYSIVMHVHAQDAQSFKRSQTSIMAAMSAGLNRASMRSR